MNFKSLFTLSSFLVLTTLIVCVTVYAINASCFPVVQTNTVKMWSTLNTHAVNNGQYVMHARVVSPGTTIRSNYYTGGFSLTLARSGSKSNGGYASAYVDGLDSSGNFISRYDSATYP